MVQEMPTACERCRSRRKRCGREVDGCAQCKEKDNECIYHTDKRRSKSRRKDQPTGTNETEERLSSTQSDNHQNSPFSFHLGPISAPMSISISAPSLKESTMIPRRDFDPISQSDATPSSNVFDAVLGDTSFDTAALLDPSIWDEDPSLFSWLDFDLMKVGGLTSTGTPASSLQHVDTDSSRSKAVALSNEKIVLEAIPSRSQCDYLMQVLEARTKASPFTAPEHFVDMTAMKKISTLLARKESTTLPATTIVSTQEDLVFDSDTVRALAGLACAFIRRSYTPSNQSSHSSLKPIAPVQSNVYVDEAAQERQEITKLIKACHICMNAKRGSAGIVDLARLQAYRMFAMVLAWWGDLKEASHVSWLGIRYATSVGLHRREGLQAALQTGIAETVFLDVFWQIFNQASMFQIFKKRPIEKCQSM